MRGKRESEEEIVYNLIAPQKKRYEKSQRHISKFRGKIEEEAKKSKFTNKTMGFPIVPISGPAEYLIKYSRISPPRPVIEGPRCLAAEKKSQLPQHPLKLQREILKNKRNEEEDSKKEKSTIGKDKDQDITSANNFRIKNILDVLHSKPPERQLKFADTCKGDKQSPLSSGLAPFYLYKKDYGRLPKYLIQLRKEAGKPIITEKHQQEGMMRIEGEARKKLLQDLKENWKELQAAFQQLPMMIDTIPKIKKKLLLEKELINLEKDIAIIENHPVLHIRDDDD